MSQTALGYFHLHLGFDLSNLGRAGLTRKMNACDLAASVPDHGVQGY